VTAGGCTDTAQIAVTVYPTPVANAGSDVTIQQGASTNLLGTGGTSYLWSPATDLSCTTCANPIATPTTSTTYCVLVTTGSCVDSSCVRVDVEKPCPTNRDLAVPNAFSPNGDGANDIFSMPGWEDCISNFRIVIFDRWGEKVFESADAAFTWDGTYKGERMNPGVVVYFIQATLFNGEEVQKKGNISLLQ
jgi:gliding motility-associated-like protein